MPRQGGIQDRMNRFLAQYLPMLYQQRQREGFTEFSNQAYLERYLKQLEAQEGVAGRGRQDALQKFMVEQMIKSLFSETEDLPFSSGQLAERSAPVAQAFGLQALPTDPNLATKTQRFAQVGQELATAKATGATPSDDLLQEAISLFGLEAVREEVQSYSDAAAKRIDQLARDKEIDIKRGSAETARFSAITRAGEPAIEAAATQKKDWLAFVTDIEDFLRGEGVKGGTLSERLKGLFSSGKLVDPLSSENRGAAFTYLGQIRAKLIQGKTLTSGDIRFLTTVRNTAEIEGSVEEGIEGKGLTDPAVSDEEAAINEATIQAHMDAIREATGETDETKLRALAVEFLKVIK
ncbi:MAG TPA: hypothetical protein ENI27_09615 [bacterium]|nr:hypothetical protein [bacterium]